MEPKDVQYWEESETYSGLKHSQKEKVEKLISLKCIEYDSEAKRFICKPIEGYNVRTRVFERDKELGFCCSCQGYQSKLKAYRLDPALPVPSCSHVGALKVWFVERNKAHGWGSFKGLTAPTREEDAEAFL